MAQGQGTVFTQPGEVKAYALPKAGIDKMRIVMKETYEIKGVGKDTITLTGFLVSRRGTPLLGMGQTKHSWENSTVVAEFTELDLRGKSNVFGNVHVTIDRTQPNFAVVTAGACKAVVSVLIDMPELQMKLKTREPMQLQSQVTIIPPIGDEKTISVTPVGLIDQKGRLVGILEQAKVMWRELVEQKGY